MARPQNVTLAQPEPDNLRHGVVKEISVDGVIAVADQQMPDILNHCHFLRTTAASPPEINVGDKVVYLSATNEDGLGCVMGLVEPYKAKRISLEEKLGKQGRASSVTTVEDEVVRITADKGLVIECGKGSISITQDGKLQIKGTDLLSRARGMNRIKGAGVNIN